MKNEKVKKGSHEERKATRNIKAKKENRKIENNEKRKKALLY